MPRGVAMISSVFAPSIGGAQTVVLETSQQLRARGVDAFVVTRHYSGLAHFEEVGGVPTYRVGNGDANKIVAAVSYILGALWVLWRHRRRYDVMHCHQMISPMTIGLLARLLVRKPLVVMPHRSGDIGDIGVLTTRRPFTGRVRIAAARRWAGAFLCISRAIYEELRGVGVAPEKLWEIANGVNLARFAPVATEERAALRRRLGLPEGRIAVFCGRLVTEKGIDVLLEAWPTVLRAVPDARALLVGDGPERAALEAQAQRLGIADNVVFAGGSDNVAPFLRAANAFVLPSFAEGLPVSLLEAMASGLPCVATAVGGTPQLLADGVSGRLVPPHNAAALAEALELVLAAPEAADWGMRAREHITAHYSLDAVTERYLEMYDALVPIAQQVQHSTSQQHSSGR